MNSEPRQPHATRRDTESGFSLVEMLIISPTVLLVLTGFVALMIYMTGDAITSRESNILTFDTQYALDKIEQDARLSAQFLVTTGILPSPQGRNNNATAFTSSSSLIILQHATDSNPSEPTRNLIFKANTPAPCLPANGVSQNQVYDTFIVYFIRNGSLWRRTILPDTPPGSLCGTPWQVNTCYPGYATPSRCVTNDSEVLKNAANIGVKYFDAPDSFVDLGASGADMADTIEVTLDTAQTVAGRDITHSSFLRATKLN